MPLSPLYRFGIDVALHKERTGAAKSKSSRRDEVE
jgi:hypothetical protein